MGTFANCIPVILKWEGGYSNHPSDNGGVTMMGITQRVYDAYRANVGKSKQSVRLITTAERDDIYRLNYWDAVKGDKLPNGLDLAVFDFAVNSGPVRAIRYLQLALDVNPDGVIGNVTLNALANCDVEATIKSLCALRMDFLMSLSDWKVFGKGWTNRVKDVRLRSLDLIGGPKGFVPPDPVEDVAPKKGILATIGSWFGWA